MGTPNDTSRRTGSTPPNEPNLSREEALTSRETAVSAREDAGHAREDAVAIREAADRTREDAASLREDADRKREDAAALREDADRKREDAAALREEALRAREEAFQVRSELDALMGQLREANEHLVLANLRSQALAEEAEAANRHKDEFIALVSHELRTPLNAVLGWARMLASKQLPETRATHAIQTIERNAASLALIIDDLLDMSRIIAGTLKLTSQPVEMMALTQSALDLVRPVAAAKHIELTLSGDSWPGNLVNGDPDRLQQVILNLLTNAVKFTPDGGRIDVSVEHVGSQMEVKIVDTGRGISADFLPHVFDRYRQADRTPAGRQGGLGLGLAIVRQLVELHGGTVHAMSEGEERGATFIVRLPILTAAPGERWAAPERRRSTTAVHSPESRSQRLDELQVLVADDHADGRALTMHVLTEAGASVTAVASAKEALDHLRGGQRPDILVSDIGLPDEDGYALVRKIRQHEAEHGGFLPAIALTGFTRAEDRSRILAAGFQEHLSKPIDPAELTAAIAAVLRRPGAPEQ